MCQDLHTDPQFDALPSHPLWKIIAVNTSSCGGVIETNGDVMKKESASKPDSIKPPDFAAPLCGSDGITAERISNNENVWIEKLNAVWMDIPSPEIHHRLTQLRITSLNRI